MNGDMTGTSTAARTRPPLQVRRMRFGLDAQPIPRDWYGGDPFISAFWCSLSLVFPEGERFFVESVRRYRDAIRDPELRATIQAFAGQEAMHGKEHRTLNELLMASEPEVAARLEREVLGLLNLGRTVLPRPAQLAVTCALEHYTAIMAEQLLDREDHQRAIHEAVRPLWLWHALEESEHKSVAFDVFEEVSGSYAVRASVMLLTTAFFVGEITRIHLRLLAERGELLRLGGWRRGLAFLWGPAGLLRDLVPRYLDYFRPDFHPEDAPSTARLAEWKAQLFGDDGALRAAWPAAGAAA